jgi:2-polyprenyl-6-methoxyphenol hydroxylase-like FAD-dependent oxidoreductase
VEQWFAGIRQELADGGAVIATQTKDVHWWQAGGLRVKWDSPRESPLCSRPFLEEAVRARVEKIDNVELRTGVHVEGLLASSDKTRITGVTLDDGTHLDATLVLDCTGRSGRTLPWIEALGYAKPAVTEVGIDMRYTSRIYAKNPNMERDWELALILSDDPARIGAAFPLEGDRFMVTLAGYYGDQAPSDDEGFLAFAKSLPSQAVATTIEQCKPLSDYRTHRMHSNQRRMVEKMKHVPAGWALLGDAVASFNPIYGQGMSSSALQAEALGGVLDAHDTVDAALTTKIHKAMAKAITNPWMLSTGGDLARPQTTGKRPPGSAVINRYLNRAFRAGHHDVEVAKQILRVGNLLAPVTAMLSPRIARRVLLARKG